MSLDLVKALKAPTLAQNWVVKLIIGAILFCIPFANFITLGYLVKALQNFINKEDKLPEYNYMGSLFVLGFKLFVGSILFALPFVIVVFAVTLCLSNSGALLSFLLLLIEVLAGFLGMIMLASFAMDEKILSMVDFSRLIKLFKDNTAGTISLIINMVIIYIVYAVLFAISCLLIVTVVLLPFISYALLLTVYNLVGQFAAEAPKLEEIKSQI